MQGNILGNYFIKVLDGYLHTSLQVITCPAYQEALIKVPEYYQDRQIIVEGHLKISMTSDHVILRLVYCILTCNQLP